MMAKKTLFDPTAAVGIDTIAITLPIVPIGLRAEKLRVPDAFVRARGDRLWLEASIPNRLWGSNVRPATATEAVTEIDRLVAEASELVTIRDHDLRRAPVVRLDVTRNLWAPFELRPLFIGLADVRYDARWRAQLLSRRGQMQTLVIGPARAWKVTFYDKFAECSERTAFGLMRMEAKLPKKTLAGSAFARKCGGVVTALADLNDAKVAALGKATFLRVGLTKPIADPFERDVAYRFDWDAGSVERDFI